MSSFDVHAKEIAHTALVRRQELTVHHYVTASVSSHQIFFFLLHDHCKKFCISYTVVVAGQAQVWCLELLLCLDVGYRCSTLRCLSILLVDIAS